MKKLMFIFLCLLVTSSIAELNIRKIIQIESNGNPKAYNRKSGAIGLMQITPVCLKEYNNYNRTNYKMLDMFNAKINIKVGSWYINKRIPQMLKYYKCRVNTRNILISYNAGISYVVNRKKLPIETINYIKKYRR